MITDAHNEIRHARPKITLTGETTIWIVSTDASSSSHGVHRGPRTAEALIERLSRERGYGRSAHVELETESCAPVEMSIDDLLALGVISREGVR